MNIDRHNERASNGTLEEVFNKVLTAVELRTIYEFFFHEIKKRPLPKKKARKAEMAQAFINLAETPDDFYLFVKTLPKKVYQAYELLIWKDSMPAKEAQKTLGFELTIKSERGNWQLGGYAVKEAFTFIGLMADSNSHYNRFEEGLEPYSVSMPPAIRKWLKPYFPKPEGYDIKPLSGTELPKPSDTTFDASSTITADLGQLADFLKRSAVPRTKKGDYTKVSVRKADGLSLAERLEKIKKDNDGRLVDIVLYHIGTNDINTSDEAHGKQYVDTTTVRFIEQTIDALRFHNPDITVLLCKIIPIKNNQAVRVGLVDYVNRRIDEIAERKNRGNGRSRIIVVDQNEGFDATNGADTYDGMHPNDAGGEKMAEKFYQAIKEHWKTLPVPRADVDLSPASRIARRSVIEEMNQPRASVLANASGYHGIRPSDWLELQRLLFRSRGIYRELPKNVVTDGYCGGPLLGNGEIGAAIGGDATSQTIYLNRVDFWNRGLGGVTISAEGKGSTPDSFRYVQDIERARSTPGSRSLDIPRR